MKILIKKNYLEFQMKKLNLTVNTLSKKIDVSPSTIYRIINGDRNVGNDLIAKLLKGLNLSEKDFDKLFIFTGELPNDNTLEVS